MEKLLGEILHLVRLTKSEDIEAQKLRSPSTSQAQQSPAQLDRDCVAEFQPVGGEQKRNNITSRPCPQKSPRGFLPFL